MNMPLIASYLAAHVFWFILFYPKMSHLLNFWVGISIASGILALTAILAQCKEQHEQWNFKPIHILIGLLSAILLYGFFFVGHKLSVLILPFAQSQVIQVYAIKSQISPTIVGLLLFFWIGPAEEIFWRGFLQQRLMKLFGSNKGYAITTVLYAAIHIYAMNFMLFLAALICGAFWGYLYRKQGSLWPVILSHSLWDVTIFVFFPIR